MRSVIGRFGTVGLLLAAGVAAGCGKDCPPPSAGTTPAGQTSEGTPDNKDVTLSVVRYPALEEAVTKNKDKVVLVDFWANFCAPCKKKFPYVVELHEKYAKSGLVCVSISVDDPEEEDETRKFLAKHKATFANFLIKPTSAEEKLMGKMFGYDSTLPQMALFNGKGERVWDSNANQIGEKDVQKYAAKVEEMVKAELAKLVKQ